MQVRKVHIKKTAAALLLLLFTFLHTAKAVHRHGEGSHTACHHHAAVSSESATCDICDFQLAKDSWLPIVETVGPVSNSVVKNYISFTEQVYSNLALVISGRGPPAII